MSHVRGKFLTSKPAKASRPQQCHWNQMRGCKELIKTISYWHRFTFLHALLVWIRYGHWGAQWWKRCEQPHVCFLTSTCASGYCNLIFLATTLCCGFFLSGEKLQCCAVVVCADDASLLCQFSLACLFCPMNVPTRRVFFHACPSTGLHRLSTSGMHLPPPQLFSVGIQCKQQCCGETKMKWLTVFVVEENKQEICKCQNDQQLSGWGASDAFSSHG